MTLSAPDSGCVLLYRDLGSTDGFSRVEFNEPFTVEVVPPGTGQNYITLIVRMYRPTNGRVYLYIWGTQEDFPPETLEPHYQAVYQNRIADGNGAFDGTSFFLRPLPPGTITSGSNFSGGSVGGNNQYAGAQSFSLSPKPDPNNFDYGPNLDWFHVPTDQVSMQDFEFHPAPSPEWTIVVSDSQGGVLLEISRESEPEVRIECGPCPEGMVWCEDCQCCICEDFISKLASLFSSV